MNIERIDTEKHEKKGRAENMTVKFILKDSGICVRCRIHPTDLDYTLCKQCRIEAGIENTHA